MHSIRRIVPLHKITRLQLVVCCTQNVLPEIAQTVPHVTRCRRMLVRLADPGMQLA